MTYAVTTVTISAASFTIYGTLALAETFATGRYGSQYTAWLALADADQLRTLVTAADLLDAERWRGAKYDEAQARAWPRSDVTDQDGTDVDATTVPGAVFAAEVELAVMIAANPALTDQATASRNVKRAAAGGGVEVEFFGPQTIGRFPAKVQGLVGQFLAARSSGGGVAVVSGASSCSQFEDRDPYDLGGGL